MGDILEYHNSDHGNVEEICKLLYKMIFIQTFIETTINLPFWKELLGFRSNFSAIFVLKMHCIVEICCVSFISLTILQLSCILSTLTWCHNLTISNCHWQYCRIWENMHQQPLCASFISLINKQMRILEAGNIFSMQRLVAGILRVIECRRNISLWKIRNSLVEYFIGITL